MVTSTKETLAQFPRGKTPVSLMYGQCFPSVETFAIACRNAAGDNTLTVDLAGSIFVNGMCVDELLAVLQDKSNLVCCDRCSATSHTPRSLSVRGKMTFSAQHLESMHEVLYAFINITLQYKIMVGTCLWCIKEVTF